MSDRIDIVYQFKKLGFLINTNSDFEQFKAASVLRMLLFIDSLHDFGDKSRVQEAINSHQIDTTKTHLDTFLTAINKIPT